MLPIKVKPLRMLLVFAVLLATLSVAHGGHELPVYPSYYPHEIAIETMPPQRAADLLGDAKLHAYVSRRPLFPDAVPSSVRAVESLGSFVIVRLNPEHIVEDERSACSAVDAILREMAGKGGFVFHPYPVTPLHGDYLYHVDQAEAEKTRLLGTPAASPSHKLQVRADGMTASLVRPEWRAKGLDWDAAVEEVDAAGLVSASTTPVNGWLGPPWIKSGWFHAEHILADALGASEAGHRAEALAQRLEAGGRRRPLRRMRGVCQQPRREWPQSQSAHTRPPVARGFGRRWTSRQAGFMGLRQRDELRDQTNPGSYRRWGLSRRSGRQFRMPRLLVEHATDVRSGSRTVKLRVSICSPNRPR